MGAILSLFTGSLPMGGAFIAVIALAAAGLFGYERIQVHGLEATVATLQRTISDDAKEIGALNADLATAHQAEADLQAGIQRQNQAIIAANDAADAIEKKEAAADKIFLAQIAQKEAEARAILATPSRGDACTSALDLIHMAVLP